MMSRLLCILLLGVICVSIYTSEAKSMDKDLLRLVRLFKDIEFENREDKKEDGSLEMDEIIINAGKGPVKKEDLGPSIDDIIINAGRRRGLLKRDLDLSETPMEDGRVLSEGDMILTPEQVEEDKQAKRDLKMGLEKRKGIKNTDRRWADKILPYVITPNTFSNEDMVELNKAFSDFNAYTCLTVQPRTNEANYITIMDGATVNQNGCWSYVGMLNWGNQDVSLSNGCRSKSTILHELGHALGFQHEQCRYDRDDHVTIDLSTVPQNMAHNFDKYTQSTMNMHGVAYDYGSVMHYGQYSFGEGVTMVAVDPNYQSRMGHSKGLSFADVKTLNLMYECGGHCTGSCPDDGYFDANCQCQCHSGANVFISGTVPIKICGTPDVTAAPCPSGQFACGEGGTRNCVPTGWICDGDNDCGNMADEQDCSAPTTTAPTTACPSGQFACGEGGTRDCVSNGWICDGDNDCGNMADEQDCTATRNADMSRSLLQRIAKALKKTHKR